MITLNNPDRNETYHIRLVPMDEAMKLHHAGVKMYDYSGLTAINTCPTMGILKYGLHKTDVPMTMAGRNLATEAGTACHDFFAAVRYWTLLQRVDFWKGADTVISTLEDQSTMYNYGIKLFGKDRLLSMLAVPQDSDRINNCQLFALDALHTAGYYDDPSDRKRTLANMEVTCLAYLDRYMQSEPKVAVVGDLIGIEIPFVLEVKKIAPWEDHPIHDTYEQTYYYCGRIDGISEHDGNYRVEENKTASSLNQAWKTSFALSHQVTGYTIAGTCLLNQEVTDALVMGAQIPVPRDVFNGVAFEPQTRTESDRIRWCEWFFRTIGTYEEFIADVTLAPRFTHSCNRFFSSCEFIPFCSLERSEQRLELDNMRESRWSPLEHLVEGESDE